MLAIFKEEDSVMVMDMALKKLKNDSNAAKDPCWKEKLGKAFNEAKDLMTYLKTQVASISY